MLSCIEFAFLRRKGTFALQHHQARAAAEMSDMSIVGQFVTL